VAMADGYARATGRTSLASLHVAAGLANGLIGMLNAARSRTPMVVLAGQQDRRHLVQDPMLSGDLVGIATPAAKSAVEVQHVHDLVPLLRRAFALAAQPPAGPVSVSVPMNLLKEEAEVEVPPRSHLAPPALDWPAAARLFGMPSVRVTGPGDLGDAVAGIEALQGPVLVEVPVTGHRSAGGQGTAGP
jgi:benzoylformate decarboxylase